jgi:hypothetical protein
LSWSVLPLSAAKVISNGLGVVHLTILKPRLSVAELRHDVIQRFESLCVLIDAGRQHGGSLNFTKYRLSGWKVIESLIEGHDVLIEADGLEHIQRATGVYGEIGPRVDGA